MQGPEDPFEATASAMATTAMRSQVDEAHLVRVCVCDRKTSRTALLFRVWRLQVVSLGTRDTRDTRARVRPAACACRCVYVSSCV